MSASPNQKVNNLPNCRPRIGWIGRAGWFVLVAWVLALLPGPVSGDDLKAGRDVVELYDGAVLASNHGDFDKGIALCDQAMKRYENGALKRWGPVFGHFYYMKGMMLLRSKKYEEAIPVLMVCHQKYDNAFLRTYRPPPDQPPLLPNRFQWHALMQAGFAHMALEQYPEAIAKLEKTIKEDPRDMEPYINTLFVQINLARCYILSGELKKGKDFIVKLLDNEDLSDDTKRRLFMVLAWDWSPQVEFDEVRQLVFDYGHILSDIPPIERRTDNPRFAALAAMALEGKGAEDAAEEEVRDPEPFRALLWYSMMAPPKVLLERLGELKAEVLQKRANAEAVLAETDDPKETARQKNIVAYTEKLEVENEEAMAENRESWRSLLLGQGGTYYGLSSITAARACYLELIENFPDFEERAQSMHNLVACSVNLGRWEESTKYGLQFFKEFPDHELKPKVARIIVEVLYIQGEYQKAYEVCHEIMPELEPGSKIAEIPTFVLGASSYHLDLFEESELVCEDYIKFYPAGQRLEPTRFYLGADKVRLLKWAEAGPILEDFLADYPGSILRPSALFLAGLTQFVLENLDLAQTRIEELHKRFFMAHEIPASYNVLGDILHGKGKPYEEFSPHFLRAKQFVETGGRGDAEVAAFAVRRLIETTSEAELWEESVGYYDEFKERYTDKSQRLDSHLAALHALGQVGRKDEAVAWLVSEINANAAKGPGSELDQLFGLYYHYIQDHWPPEEAATKVANYPFTDPANPSPALRGWLVMAEIESLEEIPEPSEDIKQQITNLYERLHALYKTDGINLSDYVLVKLARWNWESKESKAESTSVYKYLLEDRGAGGETAGFALVDLGELEARSTSEKLKRQALDKFRRVLQEVEQPKLREKATAGAARVHMDLEEFDGAYRYWRKYLDNKSWGAARAEANYSVARCLEAQGRRDQAKSIYISVFANFAGHLDYSTKAYIRAAEMIREDGEELRALKVLQGMLKSMGRHDHPEVQRAKQIFYQWRDEYSAKQAG